MVFAWIMINYGLQRADNWAVHAELRTLRQGQEQQQRQAKQEQKRQEKWQAEITDEFKALMQQLQRQSATATAAGPLCRVADPAILRSGPLGSTDRVASLTVGTVLRYLTKHERWYFVEVLNADGSTSEVRGWVYRRNVRIVGFED